MNLLVIGYGNTLRSDDGAGQKVAEEVARWQLPGVRSLAVAQLTPELAENIAQADTVIFIDAIATQANPASVKIQQLYAEDEYTSLVHSCNPRSLLALTKVVYGKTTPAYWILIPAVNFDFGEEFSSLTEEAIDIALNQIKNFYLKSRATVC